MRSAGRLGNGARDGGQAGGCSGTVVTETSRVLTRAAVGAALAHHLRSAGGNTCLVKALAVSLGGDQTDGRGDHNGSVTHLEM